MKNLLAKAMITYREREEPKRDRQEEPSLKHIQKEIQLLQLQQYHQNLCFKRMEKLIQTLLQSEVPGSSAKDLTLVESSDD